ncbi:MFS monocarboxylate transporter [Penicillium nucicola]|uniref:MFS monocarboxylate transporter n=1 Tax=Penicillium nucicola TaxID=1850975 RepID=UPI002544F0FF|nr:MFS monocarboxylate transporter [Penicillium nucicola]KAJ5754041.1 MFS monocarboxylate transporter [Penicillium nucicola]
MTDAEKALESNGSEPTEVPTKPSFPEGGLKGWLAVLGGWCVMFNTFGYINAFGIYESYYKATFLHNQSESSIAWIGSLQAFFMFSGGLISGPMMDRYGPTPILIPCSTLFIASVMLTSLCTNYYQFLLAQGVLGGLTNGLTYTPAVTAINQYFFQKRPLAMGIASSGSSLAGVIFPIALNRMLHNSPLGFGWSVRCLGFLMLALSLISCAVITSNAPPRKSGAPFLLVAWKQPQYSLQILGLFLVFWGLFVPFFYVPGYAVSIGLSVDMSFYLIAILNAGSLFGRLSGGALANLVGRFNTLTGASLICAVLIFCWLSVSSQGGLVVFSVLFGFFSGTVIGLFPATIAMTASRPNEIGSYMGMALGVLSLSTLTGTPISGAMINSYGSYQPAIIFAGVATMLGGAIVFGARAVSAGKIA